MKRGYLFKVGDSARRNFIFSIFEGGLYVAGVSLISTQIVLPALLTKLEASTITVGMLNVISWTALFLPQVFSSWYAQSLRWKKPRAILLGGMQRLVVLLIGLVVLFCPDLPTQIALAVVLFLFTLNQFLMGITLPIWFDLFAKVVPRRLRGRSIGFRTALAGVLLLAGSFGLTVVLNSFSYPLNYSLIFLVAFVLQIVSLVFQAHLTEDSPSAVGPRQSAAQYVGTLLDIMRRNNEFRHFVIASAIAVIASMPLGFFTVYLFRTLQITEGILGMLTLAMVIGQISGALFIGMITDRYGKKPALLVTGSMTLAASLIALLAQEVGWFYPVFYCVGVTFGSEILTRHNLVIEYGPVEQRSTYVGFMNSLLAPCYLSGMVGGWISTAYGFHSLFMTGVVISVVGLAYLAMYVREPFCGNMAVNPREEDNLMLRLVPDLQGKEEEM